MSGILKIKMFQVDNEEKAVVDGLNKYFEIEDLDYEININDPDSSPNSPNLTIERLITINKVSFVHVPLEIFAFYNLYNKDLTFEDENFIKFSIEIYFDDVEIYKVPFIKKISYALIKPRVHDIDSSYLKTERVIIHY